MATFGALKDAVLRRARVRDHFDLRGLSPAHGAFWDQMNRVEYERGYTPDYVKPGTPELCAMDLLTDEEFADWLARFDRLVPGSGY